MSIIEGLSKTCNINICDMIWCGLRMNQLDVEYCRIIVNILFWPFGYFILLGVFGCTL